MYKIGRCKISAEEQAHLTPDIAFHIRFADLVAAELVSADP